jgi:hypothetical protein
MSLFVLLLEFNQFQNVNYWLTASPNAYQFQTTGSALQKQSNDAMVKGIVGRRSSKASGRGREHRPARSRSVRHSRLTNTFARIGAVVNLKVEDYYQFVKRHSG